MAESARAGIALLCERLRMLRTAATADDRTVEVDRLVELARSGADPEPELSALFRDFGLLATVGAVRDLWPWADGGHTTAEVYACPGRRCDRRWVRAPGVDVPQCTLDATEMSKVEER